MALISPARPAAPELSVGDLVVRYRNGPIAVRGASIDVVEQQIVALVGPNGAGKTTFLNAIAGKERRSPSVVDGGTVALRGEQVLGRSQTTIAGAGMLLIPDNGKVFNHLLVREHFTLALRRCKKEERATRLEAALSTFPRVHEWMDRQGGALSGGERQMVAIAVALARDPAVLLVDEMSQGLSPAAVEEVGKALLAVRDLGVAVLLVEQTEAVATRLADVVHHFERGTCRAVPQEQPA